MAVKIDNSPEAWPQAGLTHADIVFEELVEGISRFAAVFHSEDAPLVGPVRSARTSDIALLTMFNQPCFAFSGGNSAVVDAVHVSPLVSLNAEALGGAYWRADDREIPHNLMSATATLRSACLSAQPGVPTPRFRYGPVDGESGSAAGGIDVEIGASRSQFVWDPPSQRWLRFVDGGADVDPDGVQISVSNIVVLETPYAPSPADRRSPEAQTLGTGGAYVLRNGRVIPATWQRSGAAAPYQLTDDSGQPITLAPGRTWVALPPPGGGIRFFDQDYANTITAG